VLSLVALMAKQRPGSSDYVGNHLSASYRHTNGSSDRGIDKRVQQEFRLYGRRRSLCRQMAMGIWPRRVVEIPKRKPLKAEYADKIRKEATLVAAVAPEVDRNAKVKCGNKVANNVDVDGTTADYAYVTRMSFDGGRFFTAEESRGNRPIAVIGKDVANLLFPNQNPIGKSVRINGLPFRVIGVRSTQGSVLGMFSLDNVVYIPIGQFERIFGTRFSATISVRAADGTDLDNAKEELHGLMRKIRGLSPGEEDDFSINQQTAFTNAFDQMIFMSAPSDCS